jgi:hypothetical protein
LANAGVLTVEDLQSANSLELAMIPMIGAKSLVLLYELKGEKVPDVAVLCGKAKHLRSILGLGTGGPAARQRRSHIASCPLMTSARPAPEPGIARLSSPALHEVGTAPTEPMERKLGTFRDDVAKLEN